MRLDSKTYLNAILTVIALLLLAIVLQRPAPVDLASSAWAQQQNGEMLQQPPSETKRPAETRTYRPGEEPPILAEATNNIAMANQEIAVQIGEMAKGIDKLVRSLDRAFVEKNRENE